MIGAKGETDKAQAERYLTSETGSEVAEPRKRRRSSGRGLIKSAIQRPAGWMQRQK
ncbi:hypothetical protein Patl1_03087 [Pistacia atlantica]|uniref:Uncharacterized protein n=1 Tax=Pistacia atlantica TaxID=434234 RepID=A0ACC1C939_9ROSI|nr:hypothetical protein Patl1_03087 [Pistacia atlantica]